MCPSRSSAARAQSASSSTGEALGRRDAAREGDRRHRARLDGRQLDDEARAARLAALVAQVAAVRASVGARDREPEAGAGDPVARDAGAREPLEQRVLELVRDAGPESSTETRTAPSTTCACTRTGACAVAEGVRDEVGDDVVEDRRVDVRVEVGAATLDLTSAVARRRRPRRPPRAARAGRCAAAGPRPPPRRGATGRAAARRATPCAPSAARARCGAPPAARRRAGRRGGCSVCTKPWIVVTGVRSSCAASATKFAITSFARSSASRDSCSCSKRRTRSSAIAGQRSDRPQHARARSSPKNGA